jgi:hypothetical protein
MVTLLILAQDMDHLIVLEWSFLARAPIYLPMITFSWRTQDPEFFKCCGHWVLSDSILLRNLMGMLNVHSLVLYQNTGKLIKLGQRWLLRMCLSLVGPAGLYLSLNEVVIISKMGRCYWEVVGVWLGGRFVSCNKKFIY